LKDSSGSIVIPGVRVAGLRTLAERGGGHFSRLRDDDTDIAPILDAASRMASGRRISEVKKQTDSWVDRGPWFLLPLIPLVAMLFRRGIY
jgi:Ca-activated chloride channel family protein